MKKTPFTILAIFTFISVFGQSENSANINLDIKNSISQKLELSIYKDGEVLSVKTLQLGTKLHENINITIPIEEKEQIVDLHFLNYGPNSLLILTSGEHLVITTDLSDTHKFDEKTSFKGSKFTQEYLDWGETTRAIAKKYINAKDNYMDAVMTGKPDTAILRHIKDSINTLQNNYQKNLGLTTNSSNILHFVLTGIGTGKYNFSSSEYQSFKEKFKDQPYALKTINDYEHRTVPGNGMDYEVNAVKPGSYLADFTLPDRRGKPVSLSQFKGKYVLVDVWSSWCGPCREEMPNLKEALQRFGKNNFMILSVSIDEKHNNWLKAIEKDGTNEFVHLIDDKGWNSGIVKTNQIKGIPSNFLLDPSGKVIAKDLRGKDMIVQLSQLYKTK